MNARIIGITGRKGHGKDAIANVLVNEFGFRRVAFADALKRAVMEIYDLSYDQCFGSQAEKEAIDPRWGLSARQIMQRFGTETARSVHPDTWVRSWRVDAQRAMQGTVWFCGDLGWRKVRSGPCCGIVVPDVRFDNEVRAVLALGGVLARVHRPGPVSVDTHESEAGVDPSMVSVFIQNGGTLEELERVVRAGYLTWGTG